MSKKPPPTLADSLYQLTFQKRPVPGLNSLGALRSALTSARRFVLDDAMSTFLGDLATASFRVPQPMAPAVRSRLCEQLRISARLPHRTTWVEYNLRATLSRTHELVGSNKFDPEQAPIKEGWLLQQHPSVDNAVLLHLFSQALSEPDDGGFDHWAFPLAYAWVADNETVLPWRPVIIPMVPGSWSASEISVGVKDYVTDRVGIIPDTELVSSGNLNGEQGATLVKEWAGVLRRVWAFLATINDVPTEVKQVVASKGFLGRGQYRRYLDHRTIHLTVPQRVDRLKLARRIVALTRRKAHTVRSHFRVDWRHPLSALCDHELEPVDARHLRCRHCAGVKIEVVEHQRGDAALGFVTHDYEVHHE